MWHYGGFVDLGYSLNFNFPANHQFRNRSTTPRVNELDLNMGAVYVRKDATELEFWRFFSVSIMEWKQDDITIAGEYQVGTQEMAGSLGNPRAFYMGAAFPMWWHVAGPWSAALRPEFYWDRSGFHTGAEQFIKAVTTTAEYKVPYKLTNMIVRLEHRFDESTGANGGFFKGNETAPGVIGLTGAQHMILGGVIWTFNSP